MFQFGIGLVSAVPTGGNLASPSFPQILGTLQNIDVEMSGKNVPLRGPNKFPDDVAPGDMELKFKASFGKLEIDYYNALMFGETIQTGISIPASLEPHTVNSASGVVLSGAIGTAGTGYNTGNYVTVTGGGGHSATFLITASSGGVPSALKLISGGAGYTAGTQATAGGDGTGLTITITVTTAGAITVTNSATFVKDLGVLYANGMPMTGITGSPTVGQYSVSAGAYTFAAADVNAGVLISYVYTSATGRTLTVTSRPMGYGPIFELWLAMPYQGTNGLHLRACRASKMSAPQKRDNYVISDFEGEGFADATGNVFDMFQAAGQI